jgi:hypothetical protein
MKRQVLRYQLTIGKASTSSASPSSRSQRLKSAILAFLGLSAVIGVLLAALVLGSIVAIVIIVAAFVAIVFWFVAKLWRRTSAGG